MNTGEPLCTLTPRLTSPPWACRRQRHTVSHPVLASIWLLEFPRASRCFGLAGCWKSPPWHFSTAEAEKTAFFNSLLEAGCTFLPLHGMQIGNCSRIAAQTRRADALHKQGFRCAHKSIVCTTEFGRRPLSGERPGYISPLSAEAGLMGVTVPG